jgi:PAS domain S-box-containing protein
MENLNSFSSGEVLSHRCVKCGKLLAKQHASHFGFEIKCNRCGGINAIFHCIKDQVIVTDPEGTILFANHHIEEYTGYSLAEVIGKKPSLWGGMMPKKFYQEFWRILLIKKRSLIALIANRHKSGRLYKVWLRVSPIKNVDGEIVFFVGIEILFNEKNQKGLADWSMPRME